MTEFNLSEKVHKVLRYDKRFYTEDDVKEFIRLLKEEIEFGRLSTDNELWINQGELFIIIDKLAGEKLNGNS